MMVCCQRILGKKSTIGLHDMVGVNDDSALTNIPTGPPAPNPLGGSLNIVVSVPHTIEIRMVDASTLSDYEMWFFISSILSGAVVGFTVGSIQALDAKAANTTQLIWTTIVFAVLFVVTTVTTFVKRYLLKKKGRTIELRATDASPV